MPLRSKALKNLKSTTPTILWIIFLICVYTPYLIYSSNNAYFDSSFINLTIPILKFLTPLLLLFLLITSLLPSKFTEYLSAILTVLAVLLWLHIDLFSISYGQLDGTDLLFYMHDLRGLFEAITIILSIFIAIFFRKQINQISTTLVSLIFIAQLLILLFGMYSKDINILENDPAIKKITDEEFFAFSSKKNVVVIVLDAFGSDFFQKILQQDNGLKHEFKGFINYTDAISQYPQTKSSLASFLTGKMIPEDVDYEEFLTLEVAKNGMPMFFQNKEYLVSVISTAYRWFDAFYRKRFLFRVPPLKTSEAVSDSQLSSMKLLDFSLFRMSPHMIKPYVYNRGLWLFSNNLKQRTVPSRKLPTIPCVKNCSESKDFNRIPDIYPTRAAQMMDYVPTKIHLSDGTPRFKLFHFVLPHPKFVYDANCEFLIDIKYSNQAMLEQSKCAVKKLLTIFEAMKQKNVYDNSMIVIMSDHGARMFKNRNETGFPSEFELKSSGILLAIKPQNALGDMQSNDNPVSLLGVSKFLTSKNNDLSTGLLEAEDERFFSSYRANVGFNKSNFPDGILYKVSPEFRNRNSWTAKRSTTRNCPTVNLEGQISLFKNNNNSYCFKYGFENHSDAVQGIELIGSDGMVVWLTEATLHRRKETTYEIRVDSNVQNLQLAIQINGDISSMTPMSYNHLEKYYSAQLKGVDFNSPVKFELFVERPPTQQIETQVLIKSIKSRIIDEHNEPFN